MTEHELIRPSRGSGNGLTERANSGTNPEDLAERVTSGRNPRDLVERVSSGTNLEDLAERVNSGINPRDLAERVASGTNPWDSAKRVNSSINPEDLVKRVNSGTNPGDLAERMNSGTNPGDLAERVNSSINPGDLTERELALKVSQVVEDLPHLSSTQLVALPRGVSGRAPRVGIILTRDLFMACFRLCKSRGDYYLTAQVGFRVSGAHSNNKDRMDLDDLCGMPKMFGGKASSVRTAAPAQEVGVSPAREAPKASSKRPIDAPTEQVDDPARWPKKVKVLTRRHKSRHDEGGSRSHSKGKELIAPTEEPESPVEFNEGDVSLVHHRPRSMKDLFKTKVHKDDAGYYTLHMGLLHPQLAWELYTLPPEVLLARAAKEMVLELDALKFGGGPEAVAKAEERAFELEQELEKTKRERDEALQRLEASEKELSEVRSNLAEIQRLLKEARVRAQKMDDELLQSVKALENARAELPRKAVDHYKESTGFKKGLKRMGQVTYEYRYRVALDRFHALHSDSEVEEDPFTIHPEDDLVLMERQQAFDDSDPPES
ncbi:hypothetical protein B296_00035312 [Ensete ventricosum]|uniref:Uncharacterized protein n=1 Tax=Ensete ventricosum TaxID=4639 RepID=A0A426XLP9_ENSVE|nr:hypothetical protein B296_00035312 [Ensete ventricosum]